MVVILLYFIITIIIEVTEPQLKLHETVEQLDEFYSSLSHKGWGGGSGYDSVLIAYDAFLHCNGNWEILCNRG